MQHYGVVLRPTVPCLFNRIETQIIPSFLADVRVLDSHHTNVPSFSGLLFSTRDDFLSLKAVERRDFDLF